MAEPVKLTETNKSTNKRPDLTIGRRNDSPETLSSNLFWVPPVPYFRSPKRHTATNIKVASILSDRLHEGLRYECDLQILTPKNWRSVLDFADVKFFLLESCWDTATGHWHLCQSHDGIAHSALCELIAYCNKKGIPTVYWNTQDVLYHDHFVKMMKKFDHVFCADVNEVQKLRSESITAAVLLPAIQPVLHNPFKDYEFAESFNLGIVYDGWADIFRLENKFKYLQQLKAKGLSIIDSQYRLYKNKLADTRGFAENILGSVTEQSRLMALKYTTIFISSSDTISTPMRQQWMAIEAAACRLPIVHKGVLDNTDIRSKWVDSFEEADDFLNRVELYLEDDLLRQKVAHLAWREVYSQHTFSHRMRTVCSTLGIDYGTEEYPLVSVIIATFRLNLISMCIRRFDEQSYPNKELVLVVNSTEFTVEDAAELIGSRKDVRILTVPSERVEGSCLNYAIAAAEGEYCIKMDDDDIYSQHFVSDMILHSQAINADVFGKGNAYIHFGDDDTTYQRKSRPQLTIIPENKVLDAHISGNSLSGKKAFFLEHKYSDRNVSSTDTCFHSNIEGTGGVFALLDDLGLVMERGVDESDHSWRVNSSTLKQRMSFLSQGIATNILI